MQLTAIHSNKPQHRNSTCRLLLLTLARLPHSLIFKDGCSHKWNQLQPQMESVAGINRVSCSHKQSLYVCAYICVYIYCCWDVCVTPCIAVCVLLCCSVCAIVLQCVCYCVAVCSLVCCSVCASVLQCVCYCVAVCCGHAAYVLYFRHDVCCSVHCSLLQSVAACCIHISSV